MSEVDSKLFKFYNGSTPWSPQIQTHCDRIDYWHSILRAKTRVLTSKNTIKRLSIKLGEYSGQFLNAAEALAKLKCAWKEYRAAKKIANALRLTYQEELMSRKRADRKVTTEQLTKMMICEERSRQEGHDSKQIRGKNIKLAVLKAEVTDFITGISRIMETQEEIVAAAAESNLRRQSQTVGTAFC